jgi:hypothetical protein
MIQTPAKAVKRSKTAQTTTCEFLLPACPPSSAVRLPPSGPLRVLCGLRVRSLFPAPVALTLPRPAFSFPLKPPQWHNAHAK